MDTAVLDCLVNGHETLIDVLELPDPDDRHVLAAAIHCGADAIVTFNGRDFPPSVRERYNVEVLHPDDFIHFSTTSITPRLSSRRNVAGAGSKIRRKHQTNT